MIITIDGPAGAGKSTVAKNLAARLAERTGSAFEYLDTGSMYRAVALAGIRHDVDWNDPARLEELLGRIDIEIDAGKTLLNGEDVTQLVRSSDVTQKTRFAADNPSVRFYMVRLQQTVAARFQAVGKNLVTEGRDQGSVVFPDSPCKIFLTASAEERARRRIGEMAQRGEQGQFAEVLAEINRRDDQDAAREIGPLRQPENAVLFVTDGLDAETVVEQLSKIASDCFQAEKSADSASNSPSK